MSDLDPKYVALSAILIGYLYKDNAWLAVYECEMADGKTRWTTQATDGYCSLYSDEPIRGHQIERPEAFPGDITWESRK